MVKYIKHLSKNIDETDLDKLIQSLVDLNNKKVCSKNELR